MRIVKRASTRIWKKKGKSIILLIIMAAIFTVSLSCNLIQKGVNASTENAKFSMKAKVEIGHKEQELMMSGESEIFLTPQLVEKLKDNPYVSEINGVLEASVNGKYKPIQTGDNLNMGGQLMGNGAQEANMDSLCGTVVSLSNIEDSYFATGDNELIKGEYPFESTVKNATIVSDEFANNNNLQIGDKMQILGIMAKDKVELEIVGIFKTHREATELDAILPFLAERNRYYTMPDTAIQAQTAGSSINNAEFKSIKVTLKNAEDIQAFIKSVEDNSSINTKYLRFSSDLDKYETMTKSIQKIADVARVLLIIVNILAIGILGLMMQLSLRDRKYEIGVLLSLGENKVALVLQILTESILISMIAFIIAISASSVSTNVVSNMLMNQSQVDSTVTQNNTGMLFEEDLENEKIEAITEIQIEKFDKESLIKSGFVNLFVIIISTSIPIIWMLNKNPKKIMLREE
jgi:ABC-type antimicrobial peptide transport system, permease component